MAGVMAGVMDGVMDGPPSSVIDAYDNDGGSDGGGSDGAGRDEGGDGGSDVGGDAWSCSAGGSGSVRATRSVGISTEIGEAMAATCSVDIAIPGGSEVLAGTAGELNAW